MNILTLKICFAPQRHALFRQLNFQKWSETGVPLYILTWHVLRATTACNSSSLIWPAGSAPASLASLLFDPLEPQTNRKTQPCATFLPFHLHLLSSDALFFNLFFSNFLFFDLLFSPKTLSRHAPAIASLVSKSFANTASLSILIPSVGEPAVSHGGEWGVQGKPCSIFTAEAH